jgi:hypothetical protein
MKENVIQAKSYAFAVRIVRRYQHLAVEERQFVPSPVPLDGPNCPCYTSFGRPS